MSLRVLQVGRHTKQIGLLVVASKRLLDQVKMCEIRSEIYGASDHCPVVLEIDKAALDS